MEPTEKQTEPSSDKKDSFFYGSTKGVENSNQDPFFQLDAKEEEPKAEANHEDAFNEDLYGPADKEDMLAEHNISLFNPENIENGNELVDPNFKVEEEQIMQPRFETKGVRRWRRGGHRKFEGRGTYVNFPRNDVSESNEQKGLKEIIIKEIPMRQLPGYVEENKEYYNMFPEITTLEIVNRAVEKTKKEDIWDKALVTPIVRNAIYRELALLQVDEKLRLRLEYFKRQDEAEEERERQRQKRLEENKKRRAARGYPSEEKKARKFQYESYNAEALAKAETRKNRLALFWTTNYLKAIKIFDQEKEEDRTILTYYHVNLCHKSSYQDHKPENCKSFHDPKEARRKPLYLEGEWNYYPIMCEKQPKCDNKDECPYSHNLCEINYHPLVYRTILCEFRRDECPKKYCHKAHSLGELRNIVKLYYSDHQSEALQPIPAISYDSEVTPESEIIQGSSSLSSEISEVSQPAMHKKLPTRVLPPFNLSLYKTEKCPNAQCSVVHCEFYHNILERRRNPEIFSYGNTRCLKTFVNGRYANPSECPNGDSCKQCHTKNEFYYHPLNYKSQKCTRSRCPYEKYCPDIHGDEFALGENDTEIIETLSEKIENLKNELSKAKKAVKDWMCPICGDQMEEKRSTGVVLCCKYMACEKCIKEFEECFRCKQKNVKAVYLYNN
eukprot:TRINITY_DN2860_c0_g1_i1.p1 TRINITY_DN2860_c0_g1~~TRINITY_DN2860_c0_g1_i1.p1  ORF type:complete len:701 (+),score=83.36 TRINITY_DN2860_c0_g1_i1:99-2105(+)